MDKTEEELSCFPKAEKYLNEFFDGNKELYLAAANDFHPTKHPSYAYAIKEKDRYKIYQSMYDLRYHFGNGIDILDLSVPVNFATPNKVQEAIISFKGYLSRDIDKMNLLLKKYGNLDGHANQKILFNTYIFST